ncbi:MAG: NTP transferase domain-containing protein [Candidatus Caldarchaeum sp.]
MDGLVLAGGTCPEDLKALTGCSKKGDLKIKGNRLVEIVVSALTDALQDGKIIVVGNEVKGCVTVSAGVTFIESLEKGLAHVTSEGVLICTEDLPFVTGDSFLRLLSASDPRAEVNYPIVPIEACKRIFPDLKRTTVQTKEGRFTGGNAVVTKTEAVRKMLPILSEVYKKRKHPFAIARMIGWGMLLRAVAANVFPALLSIRDIEGRACAMMGVSMRAVILNDPALATDVDTKEHFEAALCYVEKLSQPTPP